MIIESGVPMPPDRAPRGSYEWGKMQVGDSAVFTRAEAQRARLSAYAYKRRHPGWNYRCLINDEILRIWRKA